MKTPKSDSWKRQRQLKLQDIPTQQTILNLATKFDTQKEQALFILAYLTGGRITEIVRCKFLQKKNYKLVQVTDRHGLPKLTIKRNENGSPITQSIDKIPLNYPGITKGDITFTTKKGKDLMIISMQNRKNKDYTRKNIPIPIHRETSLVEIVRLYIQNLPKDAPLFDFGRSKAELIISKVGMNPHFLRDIRLTHLVTIYDFNTFQLTKFAGWKDARPAEKYVRLGITDLIDKF